ncbi:plasminogen activator inhibitor 1 RNA-binding protein isoform X2 [Aethina tumida]|uniref:plasminogen activator inhibitor 1 RNA-binding protein isoform X2 n=1 Tax=Aethina tumida TaxID=116153 RepID=UPI00096B4709|nr:plasminogen activator inhibitor 1 RNA-binding protein isoform X2 [Aethina tumida]
MENSYGIGVANRYALFLDDESDPLETLSLKEQEKELKKKTKVAEKENKGKTEQTAKPKTTTAQKKSIKETSHKAQDNKDFKPTQPRTNADGKPERTFNKFNNNNENREDRNNRRNRDDRPYNGPSENRVREDRPPRRDIADRGDFENRNKERPPRDGRAVGNKPGGPRGPRRTFDDRRGKREFDRQSGSDKTGVKPVDKREGGGSHNWGSHKDVIEEADRPNNENDQSWGEGEKVEGTQPEAKDEQGTEVESTPVEEEPKELTLDEWKAQRAGRSKPTYNIRKAGEGEDPSQWKKMYELRKKEEDQEESEDEEYDASEYPQRVGRQKHLLDIDIQFNDNRRPGGGRGRGQRTGPRGAGGQRGGNARGGGAGGRPDPERPERRFRNEEQATGGEDRTENRRAPKVDDERDFPSLG